MSPKSITVFAQEVGLRLVKIQNYFHYTAPQMAEVMNVSKDAYYKNRKGAHLPSLYALIALDHKLGISLDWILFNRGTMFRPKKKSAAETVSADDQDSNETDAQDALSREVKTLEELMRQTPLFRYSVMTHYYEFIKDNPGLLD